MRAYARQAGIGAGIRCCLAALVLIVSRPPAEAQQISLQTNLSYTLAETEFADGHTESTGKFSPWYVLSLRGPLIGGTDTQIELGLTGFNSGDPEASVDQRNYRLSLFATGDRLNLLATATRDVIRSSVARPDGREISARSVADVYAMHALLAYPNWPSVTLQYQKSLAEVDNGSSAESTNYTLGARHQWGPFQLVADQERQQSLTSGTTVASRHYGLSVDRSLLPSVRFRLDHIYDVSTLSQQGREEESRNQLTTVRISALPTPFLVADGELSYSTNQAIGGLGGTTNKGWGHTLNARSEVLPGLRLDVHKSGQEYQSSSGTTSSDQISANMGLRLHPTTTIAARWSKATSQRPFSPARDNVDKRVAATISLSPRICLFGEYGVRSEAYQDGRSDRTDVSVGARGYASPMLSLSLSVGRETRDISVPQGPHSDRRQHITVDASWLPADCWRLGAGLSVARSEDTQDSTSFTPHLDLGWDVDPATTLTLRYFAQRLERDDDLVTSSDRSVGLTGRLFHRLPNDGILELNYDYREALSSAFVWERVLEVRYIRTF